LRTTGEKAWHSVYSVYQQLFIRIRMYYEMWSIHLQFVAVCSVYANHLPAYLYVLSDWAEEIQYGLVFSLTEKETQSPPPPREKCQLRNN
jgi:hypothetical protein